MLRSYEPPSVGGTVSGLVPLHSDVSRPATPLAIIGPARLAVERGLLGSILSSREDENSRANGRFPGATRRSSRELDTSSGGTPARSRAVGSWSGPVPSRQGDRPSRPRAGG